MAWDDTKSAGDLIGSSEYNTHVTDQKSRGIPNHEDKNGSDASGSDGATGRVITLSNTSLTKSGGFAVYKSGAVLHTADYTPTHNASASTVTFNIAVWDADVIKIVYFT